jgi:hypothetical protein
MTLGATVARRVVSPAREARAAAARRADEMGVPRDGDIAVGVCKIDVAIGDAIVTTRLDNTQERRELCLPRKTVNFRTRATIPVRVARAQRARVECGTAPRYLGQVSDRQRRARYLGAI